jgi:hypothetical protein
MPVLITTPFADHEETARVLGFSKKRMKEIQAMVEEIDAQGLPPGGERGDAQPRSACGREEVDGQPRVQRMAAIPTCTLALTLVTACSTPPSDSTKPRPAPRPLERSSSEMW